MKIKNLLTLLAFVAVSILLILIIREKRLDTRTIYGQKPPGKKPVLYQPNFEFLTGYETEYIEMSSSGKELCFNVRDTAAKEWRMYYVQKKLFGWTEPVVAPFADSGFGYSPKFSPNGNQLCYGRKGVLYYCKKENGEWSKPVEIPGAVNSKGYECDVSFTADGKIYFAGNGRPEGKGQCDIYRCAAPKKGCEEVEHLENLSSAAGECILSVSPDEKYIVTTRYVRKQGKNALDLFVGFKKTDGTWTIAQRLPELFNSKSTNHSPKFSPDGKYFFFNQTTLDEKREMKKYWVSTEIFKELNTANNEL